MVFIATPRAFAPGSETCPLVRARLPLLAGAAFLLGSSALVAAEVTWTGGASGNFTTAAGWSTGKAPVAGDTAFIGDTSITLGRDRTGGTFGPLGGLTLTNGGILTLVSLPDGSQSGRIAAGAVTINNGGTLDLSVQGSSVSASSSLSTAGTLKGVGTVTVGTGGTFTQTGGTVSVSRIVTPSYIQSGGTLSGSVVEASSYSQSGSSSMAGTVKTTSYVAGGSSSIAAAGVVELSGQLTLQDSAAITAVAQIKGASGSSLVQSGGTMAGTATGLGSYAQSAGTMSGSAATGSYALSGTGSIAATGIVDFTGSLTQSGGSVEAGAQLKGATGATMTQSGGTMAGTVTGLAGYAHTTGTMSGSVATGNYTMSPTALMTGTVDFTGSFTQAGGTVQVGAQVRGGANSTMAQTGGGMAGIVTGIASYTHSTAGTMSGSVSTGSYSLAGNSIVGATGVVNFSGSFTQSGGEVKAGAQLKGGNGATMTQSAGTMGGIVTGVASYGQSGGKMTGSVTTASYSQSGTSGMEGTVKTTNYVSGGDSYIAANGVVELAGLFTLDASGNIRAGAQIKGGAGSTMVQNGGLMNGTATGLSAYTQAGGEVRNAVSTIDYTLTAGYLSATAIVDFTGIATQSGGEVRAGAQLRGGAGSSYAHSGGTMNGVVTAVASYSQSGGMMSGSASTGNYALSGTGVVAATGVVDFSSGFVQSGGEVKAGAQLKGSAGATFEQSGGTMSGVVMGVTGYTQSGGTMSGSVTTGSYALSGAGIVDATGVVDFSSGFVQSGGEVKAGAQLEGGTGATFEQSGGTMNGIVTGVTGYSQSGGAMGGSITAGSYAHSGGSITGSVAAGSYIVTSAAASSSSGATITADAFGIALDADGTITIDAKLSGAGKLTKSGRSVAILANRSNDFSGGVAVEGGTLQINDDALPEGAALTIAAGATAVFNTAIDTTLSGSLTGNGQLAKSGAAKLTLTGTSSLGTLAVSAGTIAIGDGVSTNEVIFNSATIASGATLYVAQGATLTITLDDGITNNGNLVNDGTVTDDLHNAHMFTNNYAYVADVASNTGTIDNADGGEWDGDVLSNRGTINNLDGAIWNGDVRGNSRFINNRLGAEWAGDIHANGGEIANSGSWAGDVLGNADSILNHEGGEWEGDVVGNSGYVENVDSNWTGDVRANGARGLIGNVGSSLWTGDVLTNNGDINNAFDAEWKGDVAGNSAHINNYHGSIWDGDVGANSGEIVNDGATWKGAVVANTGKVFNVTSLSNGFADWTGAIESNGGEINNWAGLWTGDVEGNAGVINNTLLGEWVGDITGNGGDIHNGLFSSWTGDVVANEGYIENALGGTWEGDVESNAGTIRSDSKWTGDVLANAGTLVISNIWNGSITSDGTIRVIGNLTEIVTLTNTGVFDMHEGTSHSVSVGSVSFGADSVFNIDVGPASASDRIVATGAAAIDGIVRVAGGTGTFDETTVYTILTSTGTTGAFDGAETDLLFLAPKLTQNGNAIELTLKRNDRGFEETGSTANQKAVAAAATALGTGNAIYDDLLWLSEGEAGVAFDALSGEIHVSTQAIALSNALIVADILNQRIDAAFNAVAGDGAASAYAPMAPADESDSSALWVEMRAASLGRASDGNASALDAASVVSAFGVDGALGDWRLGAMVHGGFTNAAVPATAAESQSLDYGAGVYGGTQWGATRLSLGAGLGAHGIETSRIVDLGGGPDTLTASYGAASAEAFGRLSHEFDFGAVSLMPFAGLAYAVNATSGFTESGGPAALTVESDLVSATFTTLGFGASHQTVLGDDMLLTARGSLAWQHAFAGGPANSHSFAGNADFEVLGLGLSADSLSISAGLSLDAPGGHLLDLTYDGEIGAGGVTHAVKAMVSAQF